MLQFIGLLGYRTWDYVRCLPLRLRRLLFHLLQGLSNLTRLEYFRKIGWQTIANWWLELSIFALESLGIGELYETTLDLIKFNSRSLTAREIAIARSVFGNHLNYRRIRVDNRAFIGPKQGKFCYVSFYIINSWGQMSDDLLIHELVHIWQYEQVGALYMTRALAAQRSILGYNYGGVDQLKLALKNGHQLMDFNYEQQGDIVSDYFRIRAGKQAAWGQGKQADLHIYEHFVKQLKG